MAGIADVNTPNSVPDLACLHCGETVLKAGESKSFKAGDEGPVCPHCGEVMHTLIAAGIAEGGG